MGEEPVWLVTDAEFEGVIRAPEEKRYGYFVNRVADHEQLWGLAGSGAGRGRDEICDPQRRS